MKRVYQILFILSFLSFFIPTLSTAEIQKVNKLKVYPWGQITLEYDDNVFLGPNNEKKDLIITVTPGIGLELPFSDSLFKFDYHADIIRFNDYTNQNADNQYVSGKLQINWRDITFDIYNDFSHLFERPSIEIISRIKRNDNKAGISAKLQTEQLGIQLGYDNFIREYKDPAYNQFDRTDHTYSLVVMHQTFPKTELIFEYDFSQIIYEEDVHSDAIYHQLLIGAVGDLTEKTTATIKTGYQARDYSKVDQPNFKTSVLYADLIHRFSYKNGLKLSLSRTASESTYGVNNYYRIDGVSSIFDHFFNPKLLGYLTFIYQIHSYPLETTEAGVTKKRKDHYYSAGPGLRYYVKKWLNLTLQFEHILRNSNFNIFDYRENLTTLSARAVF